jgi:hypothetical protein
MNDEPQVIQLTLDQELDAVIEMRDSIGWALLMQEATALHDANSQQLLESVEDLHSLGTAQGFCRALAWVYNYPELKRTVIEQAQEDQEDEA